MKRKTVKNTLSAAVAAIAAVSVAFGSLAQAAAGAKPGGYSS
jgi:hypothetical protein